MFIQIILDKCLQFVPFVLHPLAFTFASSVRNIHLPSRATFEVVGTLRMLIVREPGMMKKLTSSPALTPPCNSKANQQSIPYIDGSILIIVLYFGHSYR